MDPERRNRLVRMLKMDIARDQPPDLTCHFCGHENRTWLKRAEHVSAHFRAGVTIVDWQLGGPYHIAAI